MKKGDVFVTIGPIRQPGQGLREKSIAITSSGLVSDMPILASDPMRFSRRKFCLATLLAGCAAPLGRLSGAAAADDEALESGLQAWMETLYPSDEISPGAGRLNVHLEILNKARRDKNYIALLKFGIRWADAGARPLGKESFAALDSGAREKIVAKAEANGLSGLPGYFFQQTRLDGAEFYYSKKESWAGLAIDRPPQPIGYPFHSMAPQ